MLVALCPKSRQRAAVIKELSRILWASNDQLSASDPCMLRSYDGRPGLVLFLRDQLNSLDLHNGAEV